MLMFNVDGLQDANRSNKICMRGSPTCRPSKLSRQRSFKVETKGFPIFCVRGRLNLMTSKVSTNRNKQTHKGFPLRRIVIIDVCNVPYWYV